MPFGRVEGATHFVNIGCTITLASIRQVEKWNSMNNIKVINGRRIKCLLVEKSRQEP